ncbi:hypothetical protein CC1G_05603 [Coprinopsis cinerea okayama7|uniref:Uncharacterized protein n=1 Tax=Coprinopsis cinerea (strain Okayama-7 / 130 / ATCC MYA-4618 / FGSC 9003) TaxID=240176 RepID=A8P1L1_COPC7|nr:hypothetical protein CC1G_05603 [Coprinopsis cinerea okayama7\|eukprot:XP_001838122.2 hypothetical protein CC1G_05603 [Coprinopsis cinerea okayama7\
MPPVAPRSAVSERYGLPLGADAFDFPNNEQHVAYLSNDIEGNYFALHKYCRRARAYAPIIGLTVDLERVFAAGLGLPNQEPGQPFEDKEKRGFEKLVRIIPNLRGTMLGLIRTNAGLYAYLMQLLVKGRDKGRSDHLKGICAVISEITVPNPKIDKVEGISSATPKSSYGFNHLHFAALLCPPHLYNQYLAGPEEFCEKVKKGDIKIYARHLARFLYPFNHAYDPDDIGNQLCMSEIIIRALRIVLTGLSTAYGGPRRGHTASLAFENKITLIDAEAVAYTATLVRSAMSSDASWNAGGQESFNLFNFHDYVHGILSLSDNSTTEILKALTASVPALKQGPRGKMTGLRRSESSGENPVELIRRQRAGLRVPRVENRSSPTLPPRLSSPNAAQDENLRPPTPARFRSTSATNLDSHAGSSSRMPLSPVQLQGDTEDPVMSPVTAKRRRKEKRPIITDETDSETDSTEEQQEACDPLGMDLLDLLHSPEPEQIDIRHHIAEEMKARSMVTAPEKLSIIIDGVLGMVNDRLKSTPGTPALTVVGIILDETCERIRQHRQRMAAADSSKVPTLKLVPAWSKAPGSANPSSSSPSQVPNANPSLSSSSQVPNANTSSSSQVPSTSLFSSSLANPFSFSSSRAPSNSHHPSSSSQPSRLSLFSLSSQASLSQTPGPPSMSGNTQALQVEDQATPARQKRPRMAPPTVTRTGLRRKATEKPVNYKV